MDRACRVSRSVDRPGLALVVPQPALAFFMRHLSLLVRGYPFRRTHKGNGCLILTAAYPCE